MGFIQRCSESLLRLLSFSPSWERYGLQKPLPLSEIEIHGYPHIATSDFKCEYPSLVGWENCNTNSSRDCWLRDTGSAQPLFNQYE